MSIRKTDLTSGSSPLELLTALYVAETKLLGRVDAIALKSTGPAHTQLMRIRRLVKSHLKQQGVRVDDDDQRGGP